MSVSLRQGLFFHIKIAHFADCVVILFPLGFIELRFVMNQDLVRVINQSFWSNKTIDTRELMLIPSVPPTALFLNYSVCIPVIATNHSSFLL